MLIKLIELVNVDLMQGVLWTELIDLMMNFVIDPGLVIVDCVILHCVPSQVFVETIDDLDSFEMDNYTALSSTRDITYCICLNSDLHSVIRCKHGNFSVPTWFWGAFQKGTTSEVNAHVTLRHLVDTTKDQTAE